MTMHTFNCAIIRFPFKGSPKTEYQQSDIECADRKSFITTVMKSLLSNNADVNVADNQGRRPLHLTVIDNKDTLDMTALECLLEHDADPSLTDAIERMPLFYYTAFHGDDIPKQFGLLSRGCSNLNNKDIMGRPPLLAI